jgi:hypothetical protein
MRNTVTDKPNKQNYCSASVYGNFSFSCNALFDQFLSLSILLIFYVKRFEYRCSRESKHTIYDHPIDQNASF